MENPEKRAIVIYGNYFKNFYFSFDVKTGSKINYVLDLVRQLETIPGHYLKKISGRKGLYEIRINSGLRMLRLMCYSDSDNTLVVFNCFIKKPRKLPGRKLF